MGQLHVRTADSRAALYARALVPHSLATAAPGLATLLHYPRSFRGQTSWRG